MNKIRTRVLAGFWLSIVLIVPLAGEDSPEVKSNVLAKSVASWNGETLPAYPAGQPEVSILKITIPPKTSLPWHTHPVINAGYLISGELTIYTKEDEVYEMKAGDTIIEVVNKVHYGENQGDEPAVILVFYAGIEGVPVTALKDVPQEVNALCCQSLLKD